MTNPGVTILMPLKGECAFLSEAIESILKQTYKGNINLLIIDDGISPSGLVALDNFKKQLDMEIFINSGSGLVSALNLGVEMSKTELIARLDGDDMMNPRRIEKQVAYMLLHPAVAAVGSQVIYIDRDRRIIGRSNYPCGKRNLTQSLPYNCNIAHPSVMYRRNEILRVGGYRDFYSHAEDYDLWLRLIDQSKIDNIPEILTLYRIHDNQVSVRKRDQQISASMAANESFRRRKLGLHDLSTIYSSPEEWRNTTLDRSFTQRLKFFHLRQLLWESKSRNESFIKLVIITLRFSFYPHLVARALVQKVRVNLMNYRMRKDV